MPFSQALMAALYVITLAWSPFECISPIRSKARCHCLPVPQALMAALYVITLVWRAHPVDPLSMR